MLAVLNGAVSFPASDVYGKDAQGIVTFCLMPDPAKRPFVGDVIARVQGLLSCCPA